MTSGVWAPGHHCFPKQAGCCSWAPRCSCVPTSWTYWPTKCPQTSCAARQAHVGSYQGPGTGTKVRVVLQIPPPTPLHPTNVCGAGPVSLQQPQSLLGIHRSRQLVQVMPLHARRGRLMWHRSDAASPWCLCTSRSYWWRLPWKSVLPTRTLSAAHAETCSLCQKGPSTACPSLRSCGVEVLYTDIVSQCGTESSSMSTKVFSAAAAEAASLAAGFWGFSCEQG